MPYSRTHQSGNKATKADGETYYNTMPGEIKIIYDCEQCEAMGKNTEEQKNLSMKNKHHQTTTHDENTNGAKEKKRSTNGKTLKNQKKSNKQNNKHCKRMEKERTQKMRQQRR